MFDFGDLKLLKIECVNSKVSSWTQGLCTFVFLSEQIPSLRSCIVRVLYLQNQKSITPFCHELFLTFFKETKRGGGVKEEIPGLLWRASRMLPALRTTAFNEADFRRPLLR